MTPRPGPAMPVTPIRLPDALLARVDAAASLAGVTRSEMIRRLIADGLDKEKSCFGSASPGDIERAEPDEHLPGVGSALTVEHAARVVRGASNGKDK